MKELEFVQTAHHDHDHDSIILILILSYSLVVCSIIHCPLQTAHHDNWQWSVKNDNSRTKQNIRATTSMLVAWYRCIAPAAWWQHANWHQKHPWGAANRSLVLLSLVACYLYVNKQSSENNYDLYHTAGHCKIDLLVAFHHTGGKLHTLSVTIITIFSL
jgi:hypothetical protein